MRALVAVSLLAALAAPAEARVLAVGPGSDYKNPSDAIKAAAAGDTVRIAPGEYFDCAQVTASRVTIEGVGDPSKVVLTDKTCGGKGLLVTSGTDITVRNLTLTRARVPDGNGAGIRAEGQNLTVEGVRFLNNQNGIPYTAGTPGTVRVTGSLFDRNGTCTNSGGCAHGIYTAAAALVHIENTTFTGTRQGHHIKSRAARTEVIGCTVEDGPEGTASYLIEAPNGGSLIVRNSTLEKGPQAENHSAAIVIGSEGVTQRTPEILIEGNTFRNDGDYNTIFVRNLTATDAILRGNRISGPVKPLDGDGKVTPGS